MGKWREVIKKKGLKILPDDNPVHEARVNEERAKILNGDKREVEAVSALEWKLELPATPASLARTYRLLRDHKDKLEAQLKVLNVQADAVFRAAHDAYDAEDLTLVKFAEGGSFGINDEPVAQLEDEVKFTEWCRKNNLMDLFRMNYQTLQKLAKDRLEDGQEAPPGIKLYYRSKPNLRTT